MTLLELLVAASMGLIVLGIVTQLMVMTLRAQPEISDRNAAIQQGRVVEERMIRELRFSTGVVSGTPSQVTFNTYLHRTSCSDTGPPPAGAPSVECKVTYSCASDACTRSEGPLVGSPVRTQTLVEGISNASSVFSYTPSAADADFVRVRLVFPAASSGEDAVTLEDGAELRNRA